MLSHLILFQFILCSMSFVLISQRQLIPMSSTPLVNYVNRHLPGTLDGFCNNVPSGHVYVSVWLGRYSDRQNSNGNAYTDLGDSVLLHH